jgi:peptidyl-prolyl cis-trans isomerase B (cyclophilin B)
VSSSTPRAGKKPDRATKAKIAEQRARQRRADRRRRILTVVGSVIGVAAIVGALVAIKVTHNGSSGSSTAVAVSPAPAAVVDKVTGVPTAVLSSVGAGAVMSLPQPIQVD